MEKELNKNIIWIEDKGIQIKQTAIVPSARLELTMRGKMRCSLAVYDQRK